MGHSFLLKLALVRTRLEADRARMQRDAFQPVKLKSTIRPILTNT